MLNGSSEEGYISRTAILLHYWGKDRCPGTHAESYHLHWVEANNRDIIHAKAFVTRVLPDLCLFHPERFIRRFNE